MTTTCPKCATKLKDDYGMVTCPNCAVVLFVDMDGVAQAAGDTPESPSAGPVESAPVDPVPFSFDSPLPVEEEPAPFELPGMSDTPADSAAGMSPASAAPAGSAPPENLESPSPDSQALDQELDMGQFLGYSPTSNASSSQNDPNDPLGISAYANSELSSAKDGPLVVTVIISGIDTKDLRNEIRQAIQDSRFGWDAGAVMASIKGGNLVLPRISPVKASIVINRIKNLAVQIRWEQNAITELEISPTDSTT